MYASLYMSSHSPIESQKGIIAVQSLQSYAVVTPLRKAASYEPRITIWGIWGDTWLTRGKYGIYVVVRGSYAALTGST